jgi:uncharacterized protein YcbK (DUF882 family)
MFGTAMKTRRVIPLVLAFGAVLALVGFQGVAFARFSGHNAPKKGLRTAPLPKPSGRLHIYAENLREEVDCNIYNEDGSYRQDCLAALDQLWRDHRKKEVRAVDPHLYEMMSIVYDHFGHQTILLGSGFRVEQNTSRHYHASAADFRIEGVPYRTIYAYVQTLDMGGMGMGQYPTSQFVHMDYRAPGEPSFRWTDTAGPARGGKHHKKSKAIAKKRPASSEPKVARSKKPNS